MISTSRPPTCLPRSARNTSMPCLKFCPVMAKGPENEAMIPMRIFSWAWAGAAASSAIGRASAAVFSARLKRCRIVVLLVGGGTWRDARLVRGKPIDDPVLELGGRAGREAGAEMVAARQLDALGVAAGFAQCALHQA